MLQFLHFTVIDSGKSLTVGVTFCISYISELFVCHFALNSSPLPAVSIKFTLDTKKHLNGAGVQPAGAMICHPPNGHL